MANNKTCKICGTKFNGKRNSTVCHSCDLIRHESEFDWSGENVITYDEVKEAARIHVNGMNMAYIKIKTIKDRIGDTVVVNEFFSFIGFCKECQTPFIKNSNQTFCNECSIKNIEVRLGRVYTPWSNAVKARDKECQVCGSKNNLEAHHIVPKLQDPSLARDIDNGITLCDKCHRISSSSIHRILGHVYSKEAFSTWFNTRSRTLDDYF